MIQFSKKKMVGGVWTACALLTPHWSSNPLSSPKPFAITYQKVVFHIWGQSKLVYIRHCLVNNKYWIGDNWTQNNEGEFLPKFVWPTGYNLPKLCNLVIFMMVITLIIISMMILTKQRMGRSVANVAAQSADKTHAQARDPSLSSSSSLTSSSTSTSSSSPSILDLEL